MDSDPATCIRHVEEKVTSPPVLAHFDPNAKTTVTTDASGMAVGAVFTIDHR